MRHNLKGRKFGRASAHRKALLTGLAKALFSHEQIVTTLPKAKDLRSYAERLVTFGKRGGLSCRREIFSVLRDDTLTSKLLGPLAERYKSRAGGYTRVLRCGFRQGDRAPMAVIELVDRDPSAKSSSTGKEEATEAEGA